MVCSLLKSGGAVLEPQKSWGKKNWELKKRKRNTNLSASLLVPPIPTPLRSHGLKTLLWLHRKPWKYTFSNAWEHRSSLNSLPGGFGGTFVIMQKRHPPMSGHLSFSFFPHPSLFETGSQVAQAGLELSMWQRMAVNSWSFRPTFEVLGSQA